ncbi:outer membrane protein transport protein [Sphingomonas sp. CGMCC 1.13654]|uniref:Outer membrane protein transport protein n=1 Tax=Sphingomonas chungangi TaxID=2683589 RepID=A0A838L6Q3_9SPHN|nr:outer membrane protein transport protein [Sphingomonas chungangi]MBA2934727.1 outer membrane protein transport protein [Sphingomonas chungangi]MVW58038.1 aromatic hydrocarbon degradation protein [Sphingomonas chungangi]
MKIQKTALLASAALAAATGLAAQANAAAFYLQEQSTKAEGRAFSGEVSEQGAQQQWWNPAAIGGITSFQNYVGFTAILPTADATNTGTTVHRPGFPLGSVPGLPALPGGLQYPSIASSVDPVGGNQNVHNMVNKGYLPNGGFAMPLPAGFAFGFTMTSPYSFTTNYGKDDWTRYSADKSRLRTFDFQPSLAWHHGGLSIGAAPNIEYVRATLSNYLPDPLANIQNSLTSSFTNLLGPQLGALLGQTVGGPLSSALNTPDGHQYLKGSGWDVGYSFGFQYHNDKVDIGVSYKSAIKHHLKGHLIVDGLSGLLATQGANQRVDNANASFTTPWQVDFGMRYHLTPRLTLNGQVNRFGWSKFDAIRLTNLGSNPDQQVNENYKNTWSFAGGFDYKVSKKLTWRGGVQRDLSPVVTGFRDPRVPDGNRWNFATGASYEMTDHMGIDAAFNYDKIQSVKIDSTSYAYVGTPVETAIVNEGELHNAHATIFSLGGHLAF